MIGPVEPRTCEAPGHAALLAVLQDLPKEVRELADRSYELLKSNPAHPSLHYKKAGKVWSARVGLHYRALAAEVAEDRVWFWIGSHAEYDRLLDRQPANKRLQPTAARKVTRRTTRRRG
jgi:hypothetical protein